MDFGTVLGTTVFLIMSLVVSLLLAIEIRAWLAARTDPVRSGPAAYRLFRRGTGAVLLLTVLLLLRFSFNEADAPFWKLFQMLASLGLSMVVFLIAMWDFVVMRREIKQEFDVFQAETTGDFIHELEGLAKSHPQLAKKLPEILGKSLRESNDSAQSSSDGESTQGAS